MLIDNFLPDHQIAKKHQVIVNTPVNAIYKVASSLDMSKSIWIKTLFQLRGLPHWIRKEILKIIKQEAERAV